MTVYRLTNFLLSIQSRSATLESLATREGKAGAQSLKLKITLKLWLLFSFKFNLPKIGPVHLSYLVRYSAINGRLSALSTILTKHHPYWV